jgi:hypothetical protein
LKKLPFTLLNERLDRACAEYQVTPDVDCDDIRPMSWEEARGMARRGFTLGAHGVNHTLGSAPFIVANNDAAPLRRGMFTEG